MPSFADPGAGSIILNGASPTPPVFQQPNGTNAGPQANNNTASQSSGFSSANVPVVSQQPNGTNAGANNNTVSQSNGSSSSGITVNLSTVTVSQSNNANSGSQTTEYNTTNNIGPGNENYIFGYDYFPKLQNNIPTASTFSALSDYILKPQDVISIDVWGELDLHYTLTLDEDSYLSIPNVGRIALNGMRYSSAKQKILEALANTYSFYIDPKNPGIGQAPVDITIGKTAGIDIFVTGEVQHPGEINLKSTNASILNVLQKAGNITPLGSLRNIEIRMQNGKKLTFDFYDFLLNGNLAPQFKYLTDGDIVFVPIREKVVNISGEVLKPGNYELLSSDALKDLIKLAGGMAPQADSNDVQILRNEQGIKRVIDTDLTKQDAQLYNKDQVVVRTIPKQKTDNLLEIAGSGIKSPGTYKFEKGMYLRDLVLLAGGLYPDALMNRIDLIRTNPDLSTISKPLNLQKIMDCDTNENILLQPMDKIVIYSAYELKGGDFFITLRGHVKQPGRYPLYGKMTLYDLLFSKGGFDDIDYRAQTYLPLANIIRENPVTQKTEVISFNLKELLADKKNNVELKNGDIVCIYSLEDMQNQGYVYIDGAVKKPGSYKLDANMDLNSLIVLANGFTDDALTSNIEVGRYIQTLNGPQKVAETVDFNTLKGKTLILENGDHIIVKTDPYSIFKAAIISVAGEVKYPGIYNYITGERISHFIKRFGGFKPEASLDGAKFYRGNARILIDIPDIMKNPDSFYDFVLNPNDRLDVPLMDDFISLQGCVWNPQKMLFAEHSDVQYYVDKAGGFTNDADPGNIRIEYPNGAIFKYREGWFLFLDKTTKIVRGSTIIIPSKNPPPGLSLGPIESSIRTDTMATTDTPRNEMFNSKYAANR